MYIWTPTRAFVALRTHLLLELIHHIQNCNDQQKKKNEEEDKKSIENNKHMDEINKNHELWMWIEVITL